MSDASNDREISTVAAERAIRYVRRVVGEQGVARMFELADLGDRLEAVTAEHGWCRVGEMARLFGAASKVCGDPEIGRRIGEQHFHDQVFDGTAEFLRDLGSPEAAIEMAVAFANKMSELRSYELTAVGDGYVEIESRYANDEAAAAAAATPDEAVYKRTSCAFTSGYFGLLPSLFDAYGTAAETRCRYLGADSCLLRVVWQSTPHRTTPGEVQDVPSVSALERFEQLQVMAAEMALADDLSVVLQRVVDRASKTVLAPRAMLVVQLPGELAQRVHHVGCDAEVVDGLSASIIDGTVNDRPDALVVPVDSSRRHYGHIVAIMTQGNPPQEYERRMVSAFAGHASAALDGAVNLEEARRSRATAEALLDLARSLATATDADAVARRLADATPGVTGADKVAVWLWDEGAEAITASAIVPAEAKIANLTLDRAAAARLRFDQVLGPKLIERATAAPVVQRSMLQMDMTHSIAVPIAARGDRLGILVAGYTDAKLVFDQALLDRTQALADQAAAALENIRLLEQVRHQALHDGLTGLPNRILIEDRAHQALSHARRSGSAVGLLFIDLDHFKQVNDTFGHTAGDELICAVAERLTGCLRESDTVARQGGDELLVLLPNLPRATDAEVTARKILDALAQPFTVVGQTLTISASVGVSCSLRGDTPYVELLGHADRAMYEAKNRGRNNLAVHVDEPSVVGGMV